MLAAWTQKIARWRVRGHDVYVYFDNDQKSAAPLDATRLLKSFGRTNRQAAALLEVSSTGYAPRARDAAFGRKTTTASRSKTTVSKRRVARAESDAHVSGDVFQNILPVSPSRVTAPAGTVPAAQVAPWLWKGPSSRQQSSSDVPVL